MKIFITGLSGLLGTALLKILQNKYDIFGNYFSHPLNYGQSFFLDLADYNETENILKEIKPAIVIHTAYSIEEPKRYVYEMSEKLYEITKTLKAKFVFISTDLVFNGEKGNYRESDHPTPINEYGKYKQKVEEFIDMEEDIVVRTSLIYSREKKANHERFIIKKIQQRQKVPLYIDSYRSPILSCDLARGIELLISKSFAGLIHIAGPERIDRYHFALNLAKWRNYDIRYFNPVSIEQIKEKVPRDTSLNIDKFVDITGFIPKGVTEVFGDKKE